MEILKDRQWILIIVGFVLLVSNIFLIVQNYRLRTQVEFSKQFVTEEGYTFSRLAVKRLDGVEENVDLADGKLNTLLLVFNTTCEYCVQQYPYWSQTIESLDSSKWRAITSETDVDKIKNHLAENRVTNINAGSVLQKDMQGARMLFTPMTLVVDPAGNVKKVWPGLSKKGFEMLN